MTRKSLLPLALAVLAAAPLAAVEPAKEFMEALRRERYHDVALEYLDAMADSPLVAVEFKETLAYERGLTLIDQSRYERDVAKREKQLDEAQAAFQEFLRTRVDHPLTDNCQQQLGNLLVERGRAKIQRAEKSANKAVLLQEARELYDEAYRVFALAQNDLKERLAAMPKVLNPRTEQDKIDLRNQLRADYLQAQLLSAAILEEKADTLDSGADEHKELLNKAAGEYAEIYEKYRTRIAGSYARMYQGRCNLKLDKHKDALSYFTELLEQPDEPSAFRTLKCKTMNYAIVSWTAEEKLAEAVNRGLEMVKTIRPNERREPHWLELRVRAGEAASKYIEQLIKTNPKDPQIRVLRSEARKAVDEATKFSSDFQEQAQRLLAELQGVDPDSIEDDETPEPTTFAEAKDAGKEALDTIQTATLVLRTVPQRMQRETDEALKETYKQQIEAAQAQVVEAQKKAKRYFQKAIQLVTTETPPEDVNIVRYFLCYLFYKDKEYLEAATVGEFVARRAPGSAGARQSAKIALASYIVLFSENKGQDKSFETDRIKDVADYIIEKWPQMEEAEEAINTLIPFLIQEGKLQEAMAYVERIPEDSPRRGDAELRVGQALWSKYLRELKASRAQAEAAGQEAPPVGDELQQLRVQAEQVLAAGVSRMEKAGISDPLVAAALSLSQIYVDSGQAAKAIEILEHPNYGLIKLAQDGHAATQGDGVAEEIYRTGLRAYIGGIAEGSGDRAAAISSAKQMMDNLKGTVADTPDGQKKLVRVYLGLAQSLQRQIELADPDKKKVLSEVFATFLTEVGAEATDFSVLNWVAETFRNSLGKSNLGPGGRMTPEARQYYGAAAKTYERMISLSSNDGFLPNNNKALKTHLQMQLALVKRDLEEFVAAKDALVGLLKQNEMNVSVQVEAARTFQMWAAYPEKEELYRRAMLGTEKKSDGKNLVWGWGKLARLTSGKEQFSTTFHEARVQLANCRFKLALTKTGAEQKEGLEAAKRDIFLTYRLYPTLGGEAWRAQYDALLKSIQAKLGEKTTGLAALDPPPQAA